MERIDDQIFATNPAGSAQKEVPREVDTGNPQAGTSCQLEIDDGERDRDAGAAVEHLVEEAVARILVSLAVAAESFFVVEIFVEDLDGL